MLSEIADYLALQRLGTVGSSIMLGIMPDAPDACIALFAYAGSPPPLHWSGETPGLQVRTRGVPYDYETAWGKARDVLAALHGLCEVTLGGTRYLLIRALGGPQVLKRDDKERVEFVLNFSIIREV